MTDIALFTDEDLSGTGIGPEHGPAKTRLNALITKVNGMDTPSELPYTPTTGSDWVDPDPASVQEGLDDLAARVKVNDDFVAANNDVVSACVGLDGVTDEDEVSAALNGSASKWFVPTHVVVVVAAVGGTVAADGTINVGSTSDGAEILSAQALTGLSTVGASRVVPVPEGTFSLAGNATLYANVESEDTTATTLTLDVHILGRQFTPSV
jgi:hypothetical protein